jgi:hypothetical protein
MTPPCYTPAPAAPAARAGSRREAPVKVAGRLCLRHRAPRRKWRRA